MKFSKIDTFKFLQHKAHMYTLHKKIYEHLHKKPTYNFFFKE